MLWGYKPTLFTQSDNWVAESMLVFKSDAKIQLVKQPMAGEEEMQYWVIFHSFNKYLRA